MLRGSFLTVMLLVVGILAGCGSRPPAPVAEPRSAPVTVEKGVRTPGEAPSTAPTGPREGYYVVKKGDTLRRIAQQHGRDYREIAAWNNMMDPSKIEIGQELRVVPPGATMAMVAAEGAVEVKPIATSAPVVVATDSAAPAGTNTQTLKREPRGGKVAYSEKALAEVRAMEGGTSIVVAKAAEQPVEKSAESAAAAGGVDWTWPVAGKVISEFVEGSGGKESNKGIDIGGRMGEPIQAAAAGKVTYVGYLRGYGDFLVIRHNPEFISVYAHTSKILVKADQTIAKGQKIAEVGSSDADQPKLHFEIRQQSKPVDPLTLLPAR